MSLGKITSVLRIFDETNYKYARPGIDAMPWGSRDRTIADPFGDRLAFTRAISA